MKEIKSVKTIEKKILEIEESKIGEILQAQCGLVFSPMMKRLVVKVVPFEDMPLSTKSDIVLGQYVASRDERERGEGELTTLNLVKCVIVFVSPECNDPKVEVRQRLIPGMEFVMIPQTKMGYTTKMTIANADGFPAGTEDYYIINEHDIMAIIVDDQMIERKSQIPALAQRPKAEVEDPIPASSLVDQSDKPKILGLHD
jgi:hypothetical protein